MTILRTAILGYTASDAEVGAMLNDGGIISMVRVALIVMISSAYSGIFRKTGLLDGLCGRVTVLSERTSPYASMLLTAGFGEPSRLQPDVDDHPDTPALRAVAEG